TYHISSAARILDTSAQNRELSIDLKYPVSGTCFTVVIGLGHPPIGVLWNATVLTRTDESEPEPGSWSYAPDDDILIVNGRFATDTTHVQIAY
ncbi:MAG: hypothetical protein J7M12_03720, partial [Candidatus Hydrogenedentes bacterium]|nr:hypothetical protein [Candidatus Hydrogenedentota bacterium]